MRQRFSVTTLMFLVFLGLSAMGGTAAASSSTALPAANAITLSTSPAGLTLEVNGTSVTAPYSFPCDPGTNRTINAPSPQVNGLVRYVFANWSDRGGQSHVISCDAPGNYTAVFLTQYGLRMDTIPSGLMLEVAGVSLVTPRVFWCSPGVMYTVTAPSPQGANATQYVYTNWGDGGEQSHAVACDSSRNLVAFYVASFMTGLFTEPSPGFVIQLDSITHSAPYQFSCIDRTNRVLSVPTPQTVGGVEWRFSRWSDFDANVRGIVCDGPRNYTAIFERAVVPAPQGLVDDVIIIGIILGIVVGVVVLLVAFRWISSKGKPAPARAAFPPGAGPLLAPTRRCPKCGTAAQPDWAYCMACGDPLH